MLNKKKIIIIVSLISFAILSLITYILINRLQYDSKLYVYSVPDSLTMSYDTVSSKITSKRDIPVKHGKYTYTFTANGFDPYTVELEIKKGETKTILFKLDPKTQDAIDEAKKDKYSEIYEGLAGQEISKGAEKLTQDNPVLSHLPIYKKWYYIMPCSPFRDRENRKNIGVCITTTDRYDESQVTDALNDLKALNVNLDDYDIKINDSIYPTEEEKKSGEAVPCGEGAPSWCYGFND